MPRKIKVQKVAIHGAEVQEKTHNSKSLDAIHTQNALPSSPDPPPKKTLSKIKNGVVRRSYRLKNSVNRNTKPSTDHVNLDESDKEEQDQQQVNSSPVSNGRDMEEEAPQIQERITLPVVEDINLENKVDESEKEEPKQQVSSSSVSNDRNTEEEEAPHIQQLNTRPESKSTVAGTHGSLPTDSSYKSLYIDSMKKLDALMEKHYELVRKLEFANGQIDVYEKMLDKVMAAPRLEKGAEAKSLSPQAVQEFVSAAAPDAPSDQNMSLLHATDDHKASPMQKKNIRKRKKLMKDL